MATKQTTAVRTSKVTPKARAIKEGYRSGLEELVAEQLASLGVPVSYEDPSSKIKYTLHEDKTYTPDFRLPNGIIIETKGRFVTADRKKHKLIREQHPEIDIRFVFSNPNQKIAKGSATTYAMWCEKLGFQYAKQKIPESWIKEAPRVARSDAPTD